MRSLSQWGFICVFGVTSAAYGATSLPAASTNARVTTKVINEVTDSLPSPAVNYTKYGADSHDGQSSIAGQAAIASTSVTTSGVDNLGKSSTASGTVGASASSGFGSLHVSSQGSGSAGHFADTSVTSEGSASFVDYVLVSGTPGSMVSLQFGLSLDGSAAAGGFGTTVIPPRGPDTYALVSMGGGVFDTSNNTILWRSPALSVASASYGLSDNLQSGSGVLTVKAGSILGINSTLSFSGKAYAGAGDDAVSASYSADASHTGHFLIEVLTPGASYLASSGVRYLTSAVPEPSVPTLFFIALVALTVLRVGVSPKLNLKASPV